MPMHNIQFHPDRPTKVSFSQLKSWVIWQFPRQQGDSLYGAVRPPIAEHTWYPALIAPQRQQAVVYAHLDEPFDSPETAADWLAVAGNVT
jgi:hypothetical protein